MARPPQLQLPPGFRFHPTDEELIVHYLSRRAARRSFPHSIIAEIDLYKFDPWELPPKALFGEREWYFFTPRDRKYPNGVRPNRAAVSGYWKATGTDKPILSDGGGEQRGMRKLVGVKKALVFYGGRAPKGVKSDWVMHEYRLLGDGTLRDHSFRSQNGSLRVTKLDDLVLCRIYKKSRSSHECKAMPSPNLEAQEESSSLEDVLAFLPEIGADYSNLFLPRLGSNNTSTTQMDQQHHNMQVDCTFSTAPDQNATVEHHTSTFKRIYNSAANLPATEILSMQLQAGSEWRSDNPSFDQSINAINIPADVSQSIYTKKIKMNKCAEAEKEQSILCTAASSSSTTCRQQQHQQLISHTANSNISFSMASDHQLQHQYSDCSGPKLEHHFPKMNGCYIQSYS